MQSATQLALLTLSFPKSSVGFSAPVPPNGSAAYLVPSTEESTIVYALPYDEITTFVSSVSELPITDAEKSEGGEKARRWVMQSGVHARSYASRSWRGRVQETFQDFKQLLQVRYPLPLITLLGSLLTRNSSRMPILLTSRLWPSDIFRCTLRSCRYFCPCVAWDLISGWRPLSYFRLPSPSYLLLSQRTSLVFRLIWFSFPRVSHS